MAYQRIKKLASAGPPIHTTLVAGEPNPDTPHSPASLYATTFMVGVVMISFGPLLDPTLKDLGIPLSQGGLPSVGYAIGMLVGVLALNLALARVPVKWALIGAAWLQTLGLAAAGLLAKGLWSLFAAYVVVGAGCVFLNSLPGMWITSHVKAGTGRAMVVLLLFFATGMMVTPLAIGGTLGGGASWRWVLVAEAGLSLALAVLLTLLPVSNIEGRENLRLRQLREVIGFNRRLFGAVLGASVLYIGAEFILNVWLAKFEIDVFSVSKTVASLAVTLFWVGLVVGRLVIVPLTRRFLASRLLMVGTGVMALFALGVALSPSTAVSMAMSFLSGLGASAAFPLILSFSAKFPAWHAGVVFSAVIMAGALGRIVFPYLIGPLADSLGLRIAIGLAFVLAAVLALLSLYLHRVSEEGEGPV
jgi:FHS family glucose/mannose:H+ symporter-like MFS transporter